MLNVTQHSAGPRTPFGPASSMCSWCTFRAEPPATLWHFGIARERSIIRHARIFSVSIESRSSNFELWSTSKYCRSLPLISRFASFYRNLNTGLRIRYVIVISFGIMNMVSAWALMPGCRSLPGKRAVRRKSHQVDCGLTNSFRGLLLLLKEEEEGDNRICHHDNDSNGEKEPAYTK